MILIRGTVAVEKIDDKNGSTSRVAVLRPISMFGHLVLIFPSEGPRMLLHWTR